MAEWTSHLGRVCRMGLSLLSYTSSGFVHSTEAHVEKASKLFGGKFAPQHQLGYETFSVTSQYRLTPLQLPRRYGAVSREHATRRRSGPVGSPCDLECTAMALDRIDKYIHFQSNADLRSICSRAHSEAMLGVGNRTNTVVNPTIDVGCFRRAACAFELSIDRYPRVASRHI